MRPSTKDAALSSLELWAGMECTINRVGDVQRDQLALAGHYDRDDDLDLIASLGVRTVRYPILWERIERGEPGGRAWEWTDAQMQRLRNLGLDPIVGLMHHGSGPMDTNLLDAGFPERLAGFAHDVASRYPWVTRFTPINEPLTTARFSALYGIWYPHARDDRGFLRAMLNQIRATRLAMAAIRQVIPEAQLVQTEDLGYAHARPALAEQARFENERRWLTFDLLEGRVGESHPLREYMRWAGIGHDEIADAVGDGCPPDLLGINHYVTSERWLDERLERYPLHTHGGNPWRRYADAEAVRACPESVRGPAALLAEAWARYRRPLAVTEAHLGCTREQQLRWLREIWEAAHDARSRGADVRAVTTWAAFGTHDWSSLVTELRGHYEPGPFDTRGQRPRRTALATMSRALATTGTFDHPALAGPGWWHSPRHGAHTETPVTVHGPPFTVHGSRSSAPHLHLRRSAPRPILVTGARGSLGVALTRIAAERGLACRGLSRAELDVCDAAAVARVLDEIRPWAVVNAAGYVRVDDAEIDAESCHRLNVQAAATLARCCAARGIGFSTISSDLVFDGAKGAPYVESDRPAPLGVYGASKARAEARVLAIAPRALVVRTAWFFGPWDNWNFITTSLRQIAEGAPVAMPGDLAITPTYLPHLADALLDLVIDDERGIWHLANAGSDTVANVVRRVAEGAGLDASLVQGRPSAELGFTAPRPAAVVLDSERGRIMPVLDRALECYLGTRAWEREDAGALTA
jgi:dTDP-4-dehydrorhamnose reductase